MAVTVGGGEAKVETLVNVHLGRLHALEERAPVGEGRRGAERRHAVVVDDVVEVVLRHGGLELKVIVVVVVIAVIVVAAAATSPLQRCLPRRGDVGGPIDVKWRVASERIPVG